MRKKIIAGNWKMNLSLEEATALVSELVKNSSETESKATVILAPPFVYLRDVVSMIKNNGSIRVAAQNCSHEQKGAFTGEISAPMLRSIGVHAVILGHSERRKQFNEDNVLLSKKISSALGSGLAPIFCCGETLVQRKENAQFEMVQKQIEESLFHLSEDQFRACVLAYEPVWAIGTGIHAKPVEAQDMHAFIRGIIKKKYGATASENTSILYGGSCTSSNSQELFSMPDVDGGLIGGASLDAAEFIKIIRSV